MNVAQLLEQIHHSPDDLALKRVLSDVLLEQGDPRGEFIALQCGPKTQKTRARELELYRRHRDAWFPPLKLDRSSMFDLGPAAFEHGFLAVAIAYRPDTRRREWATVRQLFADRHANGVVTLANAKRAASLRSLFWLEDTDVPKLANPRLTELGVRCTALLARGAFAKVPALDTLWLQPGTPGTRHLRRLPRGLRALNVYVDLHPVGPARPSVGAWCEALHDSRLERVALFDRYHVRPELQGWELRFAPKSEVADLYWHGGKRYVHALHSALPAGFRHVVLHTVRDCPQLPALKARLGKRLEVEVLPGRTPRLGARLIPLPAVASA